MKKLLFSGILAFSAPLSGQQLAITPTIPQISVSSRGEVKVVPDRARIEISVQTKAETAAAAASENAKKQKAVIDALRALGLGPNDIATSGYNVFPEQRYEQNKEPVIIGYNVINTLSVELKSISLVGPAIDAALAKGANMITSLQFYASNTEAARQEAIAIAIRKSRSDADAAARAAGGVVSGLIDITINAYYAPPPRAMEMRAKGMVADQAATPIAAGDQTLAVDVSTRWSFSQNR